MFYTHWVPRPRFAVLHGLSHPTLEAARKEAEQTLLNDREVNYVEITDGKTHVFETIERESHSCNRVWSSNPALIDCNAVNRITKALG